MHYVRFMPLGTFFATGCYTCLPKYNYYHASFSRTRNIFFVGSVPLSFSYILHLNIPLYCTIYFLCHNVGTIFCLLYLSKMLQPHFHWGECTSEIFLSKMPKYNAIFRHNFLQQAAILVKNVKI